MINETGVVIGSATEAGPRRALNCDAFAHHVFHDRLAVAVVDGTGTSDEVARFADVAAEVAVRVAARRSAVHGIVAASDLCADPEVELPSPSGAIVVAVAEPGELWRIAWAGDCTAHAHQDGEAWRLTRPHTNGQLLRDEGEPEEIARQHDHQLMNGVARVDQGGIDTVTVRCPVLVLASDGLLRVSDDEMTDVLAAHPSPQDAAEVLLKTARARSGDDITVLVVRHPEVTEEATAGQPR
ncbi:PP2C family protein-serine/threonine phosphatase [Goodfellowiella coeruleoviolacea]|uniref:Serine/threonine protein phosphatase PrpC n=1 Tax=Goodfellowiella coeruleoviolacea TaxID=334858 RepID=A0AAE3GB26_9PSEU|nr:protein phosphatase 2C domain-containing protein [Goodfellowiella coeruleoviolacea]MCP2164845.1 Serine/threonine protein phosphatase PrpC [Goodfellowiella coeruleoviolacea]